MSLIHLENEDFDSIINKGKVLVDFYAEWCGPCKMLGPVLEEVAREVNIPIVKVDIDNFPELATKYAVMSVPTLFIFENGTITKNHIGFISKNDLEEFLK